MNKHKIIKYIHAVLRSFKKNSKVCKPTVLSYLITSHCNSHCITCNIWKDETVDRIDADSLKRILESPLFSDIEHVGISGGEPSTFEDLYVHIQTIISSLPKLQTISITSNSINSDFWIKNLLKISDLCKNNNIYFQLNLSLDGIGKIHEQIRGTKGNYSSFQQVRQFVHDHKIPYQLHTTVNRYNVYQLPGILDFAIETHSPIIFRLASPISRLSNGTLIPKIELNDAELSFFCDFLVSQALHAHTSSPARKLFYRKLHDQLLSKTKKRIANCYFKAEGIVLSSDGAISHCSRFNESKNILDNPIADGEKFFYDNNHNEAFISSACDTCYHDQSGFWSPIDISKEYLRKYILPGQKSADVARYLLYKPFASRSSRLSKSCNPKEACIIGMYGGEHVGDAAILGGVLTRLKERYPELKKVCVFSFRKDRTEMWAKNLTYLNSLNIEISDNERDFERKIRTSQLLVWAGGPIMNIPVILSRNFKFIKTALSSKVRFEIEGVGYGPLSSKFSKFIASKIFGAADFISCRSEEDRKKILPLIKNTDDVIAKKDPAFDYLRLIPNEIEIESRRRKRIDDILALSNGCKLVAINLRPLWNKYGTGFDFNVFLKEFSIAMMELFRNNIHVCFYPMNSDQFGFSDLNIAYKIQRLVDSDPKFHILETEPTISEAIYFLRKCNTAISMRFHGAIFALSQGIDTIGLDYDVTGSKGKIANLFNNDKSRFINISNFTHDRLIKQILK